VKRLGSWRTKPSSTGAGRVVVEATLRAVGNLRERNTRRKEEIDRAQLWLLVSGALAAVSLVTASLVG